MKKYLFAALCLLRPLSAAAAQSKSISGLPPLIDRDLFFGNPEIACAQLSPDGHYLAFLKPWKDTRNIWVKAVEEPFSTAHLLTSETKRPVPGYLWSRDSKTFLYVKNNDDNENYSLYAVDTGGPLFADGAADNMIPGCLPLAEGYTTTYRNFDLQKQKVHSSS